MMSEPMTPERIAEIEERCEKATKGPWEAREEFDGYPTYTRVGALQGAYCRTLARTQALYGRSHVPTSECEANADFIAHTREDIPYLLAEVKRQAEEIASVEESAECMEREITALQNQRNRQAQKIIAQTKEIAALQECALDDDKLMAALVDLAGTRDCHGWPEAIERIKVKITALKSKCAEKATYVDHLLTRSEKAEAERDRLHKRLAELPGKATDRVMELLRYRYRPISREDVVDEIRALVAEAVVIRAGERS